MTWSIVKEQSYTQTNALTSQSLEPWVYFFETFLVSKGWTVSVDETGGVDASNFPYTFAQTKFYGIQKTVTDALGNTFERRYIVALTFNYRYILFYQWDGTVNGGVDPSVQFTQANNYSIGASTATWRFLESDQDADSYLVLFGNTSIVSFSIPPAQTFIASPAEDDFSSIICWDTTWGWQNTTSPTYGKIGGSSFMRPVYLLTPNFTWGHSTNASSSAMNSTNDLLMKFNGTTSANAAIRNSAPASFEINGTYYMDLAPAFSVSFVLETGTTDMGLF